MGLLLQRNAIIEITEAVVTAVAGNERSGKEVMELLLQRDAIIEITEDTATAAAGNRYSGKEVMKLLLQAGRTVATKSSLIFIYLILAKILTYICSLLFTTLLVRKPFL
jgi:hypothetical protein